MEKQYLHDRWLWLEDQINNNQKEKLFPSYSDMKEDNQQNQFSHFIDNNIPTSQQEQFDRKNNYQNSLNLINQEQNQHVRKNSNTFYYRSKELTNRQSYQIKNQLSNTKDKQSLNKMNDKNQRERIKEGQENRNIKQQMYCKKYEQKKKSQIKQIQQQNRFLKSKIDQLNYRLKQTERELNNLKYGISPPQLSIQQLNHELYQKIKLLDQINQTKQNSNLSSQSIHSNGINNDLQNQRKISESDPKSSQQQDLIYKKFIQYWQNHACGGKKRIKALDFYINQILQNILTDSQKYYIITTIKDKGQAQRIKKGKSIKDLNLIDQVSFQILELHKQNQQRLQCYYRILKPIMTNFVKSCSELFQNYKRMIQQLQRIQQFMKKSYCSNFEFAKKRIKMQNWFQFNKYHKQIRNLRKQWNQLVKEEIGQNSVRKQNKKVKKYQI